MVQHQLLCAQQCMKFQADKLSHLVFKPKSNVHSMCAQESSLHAYCTENGYRITNIIIYSIFTE
jgi:hypothetical protein